MEHIAEHLYTAGPARPGPGHPDVRGTAAERVPALAERALGVLLLRRVLAGLPPGGLPPRAALLCGPAAPVRVLNTLACLKRMRSGHLACADTPAGSSGDGPARVPFKSGGRCLAAPLGRPSTYSSFVSWHAGETSEGPGPGPSRAGPGPGDTSVSELGAFTAPRGERVASSSARRNPRPSTASTDRTAGPGSSGTRRFSYVLDTSVLLADPAAISRFAEHRVILPIVVITELEAKRHHPELGYFARQALRHLDDLRIEFGRLDADLPIGDQGGTVRVELNHATPGASPGVPARRQRHPDPVGRRAASLPKAKTWSWSARTCRCGSRRPRSG